MNKKKMSIIAIVCVIIVCIVGTTILLFQRNKVNMKDTWTTYVQLIQDKEYTQMYEMLSTSSKSKIAQDDFVNRNQRIYEGIAAKEMSVSNLEETSDNVLSYTIAMETIAGSLQEENQVTMVKEDKVYKVEWSDSLIFKQMQSDDRVQVLNTPTKRGNILDRNDQLLATQGDILQVGIVPRNMENADETMQALANRLSIKTETIKTALDASWVQEDMFVPIKNLPYDQETLEAYKDIKGVIVQKATDRVYPYGMACSHITGYVQNITEEELEKHAQEGYHRNSIIGKSGLEAIYESTLRGQDGVQIVIKKVDNEVVLLESPAKNGEDVKTTIDMNVQNILYQNIKEDAGAAVAMHPKTGEMLGMVSSPAYDPNAFVLGMSDDEWTALNSLEEPLRNRFIATYTPGSTFKAITGAIGLQTETIAADSEYQKVPGWKWQKDSSWGDYKIPTTHEYSEPSNLKNALIYSDNIFFAQLADHIGSDAFSSYLKQLGFMDKMDFPYTIEASTYGSEEEIKNDMTLAVSGFGQGKLQVSPIHLTNMYTAFVNDGNLVQPYLQYADGAEKIWKKDVFSKETAATIYADLVETMHKYGANPTNSGAKTGTAEIGEKEIGWISSVSDDYAITIMIDDTSTRGGSAYNIPMLQKILQDLQ